ncbi:MAG: 4'-phosphopantetheinyl transferase superfamily protein [Salinivirgaceae bacterium]|nr:4'-phosphopantetheinyl transferase superfamily protein [Salinivirgaceae bacterium]
MSLIYKDNIAHGASIAIWKKEESLDFLESVFILNKVETEEYGKITNEFRKQEWLTTRILLTELIEQRTTIKHNENGKPYIENHFLNISISHSKQFVSIVSSKFHNPGIDIEQITSRPVKIKHKFLGADELSWCRENIQLTAAWSSKETIYKTFEKNLDYHDIIISENDFLDDKGLASAEVIKKGYEKSFSINYMHIEDNILTYVLRIL